MMLIYGALEAMLMITASSRHLRLAGICDIAVILKVI